MTESPPELVRDLAEKLKCQVRVAAKGVSQSGDTHAVQGHGSNGLDAVHVVTALREPEHVVSKQKRHHPALAAGEVPERLDDPAADDEDGVSVRAFPINELSARILKRRCDAGDLRALA